MKILNSNSKNFDKSLDILLLKRKNKIQSNSISVTNIIKDVRKNGDKSLLKYERRFNNNNTIFPSIKKINNSIKSLNPKVKKAIDIAADKDFIEFDLAAMPGITNDSLNSRLLTACEERADAMAVLDIRGGYKPPHENNSLETANLGSVEETVTALKDLNLNSSYGCAFYPFVKIRGLIEDMIVKLEKQAAEEEADATAAEQRREACKSRAAAAAKAAQEAREAEDVAEKSKAQAQAVGLLLRLGSGTAPVASCWRRFHTRGRLRPQPRRQQDVLVEQRAVLRRSLDLLFCVGRQHVQVRRHISSDDVPRPLVV